MICPQKTRGVYMQKRDSLRHLIRLISVFQDITLLNLGIESVVLA